MIWTTVSSWSCFCWLFRASPPLVAKNIINLISVLTLWWCPRVESSLELLEEGVCYEVPSLGKSLLTFDLLCFVLQGQSCLVGVDSEHRTEGKIEILNTVRLDWWRRKWKPTPVFLPRESQGQRSLVGWSTWGHKELDMTDQLSTAQNRDGNRKLMGLS